MALTSITTNGVVFAADGDPITLCPAEVTNGASVGQKLSVALTEGDNTIALPGNTLFISVRPSPNNTVALTLGGSGGQPIHPGLGAQSVCVPGGTTSLTIYAAASVTVEVTTG